MKRRLLASTAILGFLLSQLLADKSPPAAKEPTTVVPVVQKEVQPFLDANLKDHQAIVRAELKQGTQRPALFRHPLCDKGLTDPWAGMGQLEQHGQAITASARGGLAKLADLLDRLAVAGNKPAGKADFPPRGKLDTLDDHVRYLESVLDRARKLHDEAMKGIAVDQRKAQFDHAPNLLQSYGPQLPFNDRVKPILENDRTFFIGASRIEGARHLGAAQTMLALLDSDYIASLKTVLDKATPIKEAAPGVTGDVLFRKETAHGLILIGSKGANTYDLKVPVALLIDLGGDDQYKGRIAANAGVDNPISVVIDLGGNDRYDCDELGLATGRFGIGLLADLGGNDTYNLAPGSGGVGFAGIGLLIDADGKDTYTGSKFTLGVGLGGVGLVYDLAGDDRYTSFGYSIGLGGSLGVGAVIDVAGDDSYQCGHKYGSGYNASDAPSAKPGDANYQYDAWGMGIGLGRRVFSREPGSQDYNLSGGLGMVLDLAGNDRYDSSNFSQACGYFFGIGLKLDLAGDDVHKAARYGHASGAHFGMGLFIDYTGKDTYDTAGPTYNGGCAWDHSAFLCIDAGDGDDTYKLERSSGLGRADIGSWGVFADLGGRDVYKAPGGVGRVSDKSLSVFLDLAGIDDYTMVPKLGTFQPVDGKTHTDGPGGVFIDR